MRQNYENEKSSFFEEEDAPHFALDFWLHRTMKMGYFHHKKLPHFQYMYKLADFDADK